MIRQLRTLFRTPTPLEIATRDLDDTKRELLSAHTRKEAYQVELASCNAHIEVLRARQARLEAYCTNSTL